MATVRLILPTGVVASGTSASRGLFDFRNPLPTPRVPEACAPIGSGFELVDTVTLVAAPTANLRGAPAGGTADIEVTVEEGYEVVGLSIVNGVPRWIFPREAPGTRGGSQVRTLPVPIGVNGDGTRGLLDGLARTVVTHVLRFLAKKVVAGLLRELVKRHEAPMREGPVHITGPALADFRDVDDIATVAAAGGRVLVLVHGTFSTTRGSFGALAEAVDSPLPGWLAGYQAVIGFDHHTLSRTPEENARAIAAQLRSLPANVSFDILCYSRGGLVARTLTERVFDDNERARVGMLVGVATTYGGTLLARPANWNALLDRMTALAVAVSTVSAATGPGAVIGLLATSFGGLLALVKALAEATLSDGGIPGLAAMDPDDGDAPKLDAKPVQGAGSYTCITSDFEPGPGGAAGIGGQLGAFFADAAVDKLFAGAANDLVVHNASTLSLPDAFGPPIHHVVDAGAAIHHCGFFRAPQVQAWLGMYLAVAASALESITMAPTHGGGFRGSMAMANGHGPMKNGGAATPAPAAGVQLHLGADAPTAVEIGTTFAVGVGVSREAVEVGAGGLVTALVATAEQPLVIAVNARRGCRLLGEGRVQRPVPEPGMPIKLEFDVEATDLGAAEIAIRVRQGNDVLGAVTLTPRVRVAGRGDGSLTKVAASSAVDRPLPSEHVLNVGVEQSGGQYTLRYFLESPGNDHSNRYGPFALPGGPVAYTNRLYARIEQEWQAKSSLASFERQLKGLGRELFEGLLPPDLRRDLWKLQGKLPGIQIESNDSSLPWELVLVCDPDSPGADAGFLAEWGLVRALDGRTTPDTLSLTPARVVRPSYPASFDLPHATAEQDFLQAQLGATALPATKDELEAWFDRPESTGVFHFAGHGQADDEDLRLIMGQPVLPDGRLGNITASALGSTGAFPSSRPIVFINACRVGQVQQVLAVERSWARTFLAKRAAAVVVPLWAVGDATAFTFAKVFYEQLLNGDTCADAVTAARMTSRAAGDPTWLAYTVYATPHARVAP